MKRLNLQVAEDFPFVGIKCSLPLTRAKIKYSWDLAEHRLKHSKLDLLY